MSHLDELVAFDLDTHPIGDYLLCRISQVLLREQRAIEAPAKADHGSILRVVAEAEQSRMKFFYVSTIPPLEDAMDERLGVLTIRVLPIEDIHTHRAAQFGEQGLYGIEHARIGRSWQRGQGHGASLAGGR